MKVNREHTGSKVTLSFISYVGSVAMSNLLVEKLIFGVREGMASEVESTFLVEMSLAGRNWETRVCLVQLFCVSEFLPVPPASGSEMVTF